MEAGSSLKTTNSERREIESIARTTKILCIYFVWWNDDRRWNDAMRCGNIAAFNKIWRQSKSSLRYRT